MIHPAKNLPSDNGNLMTYSIAAYLRRHRDSGVITTISTRMTPSELDSSLRTGCSPVGHFALSITKSSQRYFSMYGRNFFAEPEASDGHRR
ncbi:hypothetical protein [Alloactinosynnema sp. L-07]|nr:hypothetical protein [Alloactinosynnema sp. L-07]